MEMVLISYSGYRNGGKRAEILLGRTREEIEREEVDTSRDRQIIIIEIEYRDIILRWNGDVFLLHFYLYWIIVCHFSNIPSEY